jgi:putative SOS response-associated peptidase YedK
MGQVHNEKPRMPAVLREQDHEAWISGSIMDAKAALAPYPSKLMVTWQVSRRVNSPKAPNEESLILPV